MWRGGLLIPLLLCHLLVLTAKGDRVVTFPNSRWTWRIVEDEMNNLWMRSYLGGVAQFDYRVGAGGCIAEMRACYLGNEQLLCPTWVNSAYHDRDNVLMWVMWAGATIDGASDEEDSNSWKKRWNVNQAGGHDGFAPVSEVVVDVTLQGGVIEVFSQSDEQFIVGYDDTFRSTQGPDWVSQHVRYDLLDKGVLKITHTSVIPTIHRNNIIVHRGTAPGQNYHYAYFEKWSTFFAAPNGRFNGLARKLTENGSPDQWFQFGQNMPSYQDEPLSTTSGYAVAFQVGGYASGEWPVVGVVSGTKDMEVVGAAAASAEAYQNFFEWIGAGELGYVAILPACNLELPMHGSVVVYETYLLARASSDGEFVKDLNFYSEKVTPPRVYGPEQTQPLFEKLRRAVPWEEPQNSHRIAHLAPLAVGLSFPTEIARTEATKEAVSRPHHQMPRQAGTPSSSCENFGIGNPYRFEITHGASSKLLGATTLCSPVKMNTQFNFTLTP